MAEVFEDSYSAEALANMENYIISFGTMIKEVGSSDAFKNALFGLKVMIDKSRPWLTIVFVVISPCGYSCREQQLYPASVRAQSFFKNTL